MASRADFIPRPTAGERDEDLLKLQEKFMQSLQMASENLNALSVSNVERIHDEQNAKVESGSDSPVHNVPTGNAIATRRALDNPTNAPKKRVMFSDVVKSEPEMSAPMDTTNSVDANVDDLVPVLLDVVERDVSKSEARPPISVAVQSFPKARLRKKQLPGDSTLSVFAQQMQNSAKRSKTQGPSVFKKAATNISDNKPIVKALGNTSIIVDGTGLGGDRGALVKAIHDENVAKIGQMSQQEILEEQQKLMETLDASSIAFLKSKRFKSKNTADITQNTYQQPKPASEQSESAVAMKIKLSPKNSEEQLAALEGENVEEMPLDTKRWVHMDKVEWDKLAWTTDLPEADSNNFKVGMPARFNFDGIIISCDVDVPTHVGLHHHGENPEVPGYTLEELFTYGRSSVQQQRVLALSTLANILQMNSRGSYDNYLTAPLLPQLLDAGLVVLLRWALDDNSSNSVAASVAALHALLVVTEDELCLDRTFSWYEGSRCPFLQPQTDFAAKGIGLPQEGPIKEEELDDAELVKQDMVKGLLRMDLLPRLRYILEVGLPDAAVTIHILEILIRVARHSVEMAHKVVRCPRLLQTIVRQYLPHSWNIGGQVQVCASSYSSTAKGVPLCQAVKLVRVLATASHFLVEPLLKEGIMRSLLCYASIDPRDDGLPVQVVLQLCVESYRAWKVFLHYDQATQSFLDYFPVIMGQLQYYQTLCINMDVGRRLADYDHATSVLGVLTAAVIVARRGVVATGNTPPVQLEWRQVHALAPMVELCVKKWLWELLDAEDVNHSTLALVGTALDFVANFYDSFTEPSWQRSFHNDDALLTMLGDSIVPFLDSNPCRKLMAALVVHSPFLCRSADAGTRYPDNLPSVGAILWDGKVNGCLESGSPFPMMSQLVRAIVVLYRECFSSYRSSTRIYESIRLSIINDFINNPLIVVYLQRLIKRASSPVSHCWLSRFETHFLYHLCTLASIMFDHVPASKVENVVLYHRVALFLLPNFYQGDEHLAQILLTSVIFNQSIFVPELARVSLVMEGGSQEERILFLHPMKRFPDFTHIKATYLSVLDKHFQTFGQHNRLSRYSLSVSHYKTPPVPAHFVYLPITQLYSKVTLSTATPSTMDSSAVLNSLQFAHFLESFRVGAVTTHSRFCYLCLVFLASTDIFLNPIAICLLEDLLVFMYKTGELTDPQLEKTTIAEVASFHDLYAKLLDQFEAVSYGSKIFANVILVPLQQKYSAQLRKNLFTEHVAVARSIQLKVEESIIPFEEFAKPVEADADLLACYFSAIVNDDITLNRNQFLFMLAVHHLHFALFAGEVSESLLPLRDSILEQLQQPKNQEIRSILMAQRR